jgi:hypothetical protein
MITTMNSFWFLEPPASLPPAKESPDTRYEQVTCPLRDGHRRGGKRIGELSVVVHPSGVRDVVFSWSADILLSKRTLELFEEHRVTGFETKRARTSYPKNIKAPPPELFELVVVGWGGWAAPAAGVTLAESCPGCGHKVYSIAEPSRLLDPTAWDGSDLFIVWPLPGYRFVSDRLASILRRENVSGVKLLPASALPTKRGAHVSPSTLANHMPEARARELGQRFGIS